MHSQQFSLFAVSKSLSLTFTVKEVSETLPSRVKINLLNFSCTYIPLNVLISNVQRFPSVNELHLTQPMATYQCNFRMVYRTYTRTRRRIARQTKLGVMCSDKLEKRRRKEEGEEGIWIPSNLASCHDFIYRTMSRIACARTSKRKNKQTNSQRIPRHI